MFSWCEWGISLLMASVTKELLQLTNRSIKAQQVIWLSLNTDFLKICRFRSGIIMMLIKRDI